MGVVMRSHPQYFGPHTADENRVDLRSHRSEILRVARLSARRGSSSPAQLGGLELLVPVLAPKQPLRVRHLAAKVATAVPVLRVGMTRVTG